MTSVQCDETIFYFLTTTLTHIHKLSDVRRETKKIYKLILNPILIFTRNILNFFTTRHPGVHLTSPSRKCKALKTPRNKNICFLQNTDQKRIKLRMTTGLRGAEKHIQITYVEKEL